MTTVAALVVVSIGSFAFRLVPLVGAARIPEPVARFAGWAGVSVLAAITVRSVVHHHDPATPAASPVAAVSVVVGLSLAVRGRSVPTVLVVTVACYSALALALRGLT